MGDGTIYTDLNTIAHDYTTEGIYPIEVIAWDLTCNVSDTIYDTLHFITALSTATANAPADTTLCSSPPFEIPFTSDGSTPSVFWDFGDGNTSTAQNPTNTFAVTGIYTVMFVAIDPNTCNIADTAYFDVELIQAPTFSASFDLPIIPPCSDPDSVMVNVDISGTGIDSTHWDMGDGTTFEDSTSISYNYTSTGVYDIVITAWDYCGGDTSIFETFNFITDSSLAVASAPEDTVLCTLPPFSISFTSSGVSAGQLWDFGDGGTSNIANPTHVFADSGTYVVTYIAIDSSTCNIADTAYFNVNLIQAEQFSAEINFTPPPPCGGDSMLVDLAFSGTAADSLIWNMGNGAIFNTESVSYYYTESGIYNLSLTAFDFTCDLTEVISSEVPFFGNISTDIIIPNVFTPNGDGENDLLTFVNVSGSETFGLTIWNRWGKKVFVTDDPLDHWDGSSMKDKSIHEGVYYFEILFTDLCSDEQQIKTGFVHLMR
jgi:gliding motility-associated-like protein